ncbi:MAG: archaetidylserine decarboxylase [Gammaproteobacteria bacterium]
MSFSTPGDWLKSWPLAVLPHHLLSRLVRSATRWRVRWWKNLLIGWFIHHFNVDMSEAAEPSPADYPDFNSFFTRSLKPGSRPQPEQPGTITCPVDGRISQIGGITDGRLIQAKGHNFSLVELLGGNDRRAAAFQEGGFATLYLSPRDYHRIHMPCDARLVETAYIPGRLYSVAPHTTRTIPGLFTRNERLAALFETPAGPIAMVLVGAIFVASMETVWEGVIQPAGTTIRVCSYPGEEGRQWQFRRGDEMGRFNMGSTVILLHGPGQAEWNPELSANQSIRIGQILGRFMSGP